MVKQKHDAKRENREALKYLYPNEYNSRQSSETLTVSGGCTNDLGQICVLEFQKCIRLRSAILVKRQKAAFNLATKNSCKMAE